MRKFSPDVRNFGGRKVISDNFRNHYGNLANIQSTLKTRKSLQSSLSQNRKTSQKSPDNSFHVTKGNQNVLSEHLLNIKHMNRRINSIGSVITNKYNERKKNPFDPITHPVVFFRNGQEGSNPTLTQKFITRSTKPPKLNSIYESREKRVNSSFEVKVNVPYIESTEKNPTKVLNAELLDIIVKHRVYKEDDLQELFKFTRQANSHLSQSVLDKALSMTYKTLNT